MKSTIKTLLPLVAVALVLTLTAFDTPREALSFAHTGDSWAQSTASYRVNPNFTDATAGTSAQQIAVLQRAASEWRSAGQVPFEFIYGGTTTTQVIAPNDGVNAVFYLDQDGGGALATTTWSAFSNGDIAGFDIAFYDRDGAMNFVWAQNPNAGQFDIESVGVHEFGHALGMAHSDVSTATMFASVAAGDIQNRTLHSDDIAGVQALYGTTSTGDPTLSSLTPGYAWIGGGDRISINGNEFAGGDPHVVTFDGVPATDVTIIDNGRLECDLPPGVSGGPVDVGVTHAGGTSTFTAAFFNQSIRITQGLRVGQTGQLEIYLPSDSNLAFQACPAWGFQAGLSCSSFGAFDDTRVIPINTDSLFYDFLNGDHDPIFTDFASTLDGSGRAFIHANIPNDPQLIGVVICVTVVSLDSMAQSGIRSITNAAAAMILP